MAHSARAHLQAIAMVLAACTSAMACSHDWDSFAPIAGGATGAPTTTAATGTGGTGGSSAPSSASGPTGPGGSGAAGGTGGAPTNYRDAVLADAPLAYWRLGTASSTEALDEIAPGHPGTYVGTVTVGEPGAITGDPDTAVRFDGSTAQILIGDYFDFAAMATFSVEAWIRPDDVQPAPCCSMIVSKQVAPLDDGWQIGFSQEGQTAFVAREVDPIYDLVASQIPAGKYVHVVGTFAAATLRLYVDGLEAQTLPTTVALSDQAAPLKLGARDVAEAYAGLIDEVALYDHALSADRVMAHFAAAGAK